MKTFAKLAAIAGMATCMWGSGANATVMTASWTGGLWSDGSTTATGFVANNSLINLKFTYDTNDLGTFENIIDGKLVKYSKTNLPSIYSQITISINGGSALDITSFFAPNAPQVYSDVLLGTNSDRYRNAANTANNENWITADFARSGALLSLNPEDVFSLANIDNVATFWIATGSTNIHGYLDSLNVYASGPTGNETSGVPAPGALALLGLGLLGFGALRRKRNAA